MSLPIDDLSKVILDSITDGVFTVDREWRITSFNRAAERITGIPAGEAVGRRCCEVFRASICESDCALRQTFETGKPVVNQSIYIVSQEGRQVPVSISTALLKDHEGHIIGGVETFRDLSVVEELRKELSGNWGFADMVGKSRAMRRLFDVLPEIALSESIALIEGESGTGKELIARAIHNLSARCAGPMVSVNCAALPDTLLASELFGHVAGAFTDARNDKPGRFARAEGGTLFLDEIGDVSPAMQVQLLRVLQEKEYEPVGAPAPVKADVRVIAATNKDLRAQVEEGRFREDLYYRIHVVALRLPALRERREDIPLLAAHFIERFNRLRGRDVTGVADEVMEFFMRHPFRGNVRELENLIEHAFILCKAGPIEMRHLPAEVRPEALAPPASGVATLSDMERDRILAALARHGDNRAAAARELGIHKTTLWRKLKKLGLA